MEEKEITPPEQESPAREPELSPPAPVENEVAPAEAVEANSESGAEPESISATEDVPTSPVDPPQSSDDSAVANTQAVADELGIQLRERPTEDTDEARFRALLEAIIYIAEEPMSTAQIATALDQPEDRVKTLIAKVIADCEQPGRGLLIREVAGGFKMGTKPEFHDELRTFVKRLKPPLKLSLAALETLAVIAYKQPITGPEIMEIRGVQGAGVLKTLLDRKLITAAGRKQVVGRPVLYKTTKDFLIQFGLKDLGELPTLKEFEEWSRLAIGEPEAEAAPVRNEPIPATGPGTPPVPPVQSAPASAPDDETNPIAAQKADPEPDA